MENLIRSETETTVFKESVSTGMQGACLGFKLPKPGDMGFWTLLGSVLVSLLVISQNYARSAITQRNAETDLLVPSSLA